MSNPDTNPGRFKVPRRLGSALDAAIAELVQFDPLQAQIVSDEYGASLSGIALPEGFSLIRTRVGHPPEDTLNG